MTDGVAATAASLSNPYQTWIDSAETFMYIVDSNNCRVRKVSLTTATITTFAGTACTASSAGDGFAATAAAFYSPFGVCGDSIGHIYISEASGLRVRVVNASSSSSNHIIKTYAGSGIYGFGGDLGLATATAAQLANIQYVAVDTAGNLFIADIINCRIRKVRMVYTLVLVLLVIVRLSIDIEAIYSQHY